MPYDLPPLPYDADALEPYISLETMKYHYGKHHQGYVDKLNDVIKGTNLEGATLEVIVRAAHESSDQYLFNNAAQVWNHNFFWNSMTDSPSKPSGRMTTEIEKAFGGVGEFIQAFKEAALGEFGSGWAWLILGEEGLEVFSTTDAESPIAVGQAPLLCCDVWEHAYYLDYRNDRAAFIDAFLEKLINWKFAAKNLGDF